MSLHPHSTSATPALALSGSPRLECTHSPVAEVTVPGERSLVTAEAAAVVASSGIPVGMSSEAQVEEACSRPRGELLVEAAAANSLLAAVAEASFLAAVAEASFLAAVAEASLQQLAIRKSTPALWMPVVAHILSAAAAEGLSAAADGAQSSAGLLLD